jgi:hypothetical protein
MVETAMVLLQLGRIDEAKAALDAAKAAGVSPGEVVDLDRLLVKALNGPSWRKTYEHESRHYHVYSNIDVDSCREAARVLEDAHQGYRLHLERARPPGFKYRVYLFSGEAGYLDYIHDLQGSRPHSTLGVYIPLLKQLLIWNHPDRNVMMTTVRHEGFHQYLDSLVDDAPVWFNEGMAEYYEIVGRDGGKWVEGAIHEDHLRLLAAPSSQPMPVARLIAAPTAEFYDRAPLTYAQAWALVHFLRHGPREYRAVFDRLFDALLAGDSAQEAVDAAVRGVDMQALQADFDAYVDTLAAEHLGGA